MFVAFEGAPLILRLYGTGRVVLPGTSEWARLSPLFEMYPGVRQIVHASLHAVKTSCGFSVPFFDYAGERELLKNWAETKGDGLTDYHLEKNTVSMDGLATPLGLKLGGKTKGTSS